MYWSIIGKDTSSDSVRKLPDRTRQGQSADCPDWPRARLCKHIAAVAHFSQDGTIQITRAAPEPQHEVHESPQDTQQDTQGDASPPSNASAAILENLITVSREYLSDGPPSSPGTVWSLRLVESRLTAVIQNCALLRVHSRIGKTSRLISVPGPRPPREWGKATEEIASHQQFIARPPSSRTNWDAQSQATPHARTAAQNEDARARVATTTDGAEAPPSQPTKRRRKRASTPPPPPPSSAPVPGPSAHWYPNAAYSQVPYHATYPMYWHYGHFPPSQPYYPSTQ
ncbi:hypothetical protein EDB84DRAFT_1562258 [Lactarius hengduanensis]|nr:hypothetical protein EDB84DRAFT_1562258 [Lactarius hengduanensis]